MTTHPTCCKCCDLIERQHAKLTRLRAIEEAAMDVVAADLIDNVWLRDKWIPALRAALREKGAENVAAAVCQKCGANEFDHWAAWCSLHPETDREKGVEK